MKGGITLGLYLAIGITGAAFGQQSTHPKNVPPPPKYSPIPPSMEMAFTTRQPLLEQLATQSAPKTAEIAQQLLPASTFSVGVPLIEQVREAELAALPNPVVMHKEIGGSIPMHENRFRAISRAGAKVEMRGGCYSACTLITGYIPKEKLCFGQGAFLAFHAATSDEGRRFYAMQSTQAMYMTYPAEIKTWIDRHGGWEKLTIGEYWTLYDRDLWAMGYAKCQ